MRRDNRLVEIQLRTKALHFWAEFLETVAAQTNTDLKHGHGPAVVFEAFRGLGELLHGLETGTIGADDTSADEIATLVEPINRFMRGEQALE